MIMYGKENPLIYTPQEIFNPTTANMILSSMKDYATAVRQDYKDAVEKEEQFLKENSQFISPSQADTEYFYNNTLGGMNALFNAADQQGIDLLRSQQGRALIQRYIMSRPYNKLSQIRETAKNLELFNKAKQQMIMDGTYNEALQTANNLQDPLSWNTNEQGIWNTVSPYKYFTKDQIVDPWVEKIKEDFIKNKNGYTYEGVTSERINNVIDANVKEFFTTPMGKLYLQEYGSQEEAEKFLKNYAAKKFAYEKQSTDQAYWNKKKDELDWYNAKTSRMNAEANQAAAEAKRRNAQGDTTGAHSFTYNSVRTSFGNMGINIPSSQAEGFGVLTNPELRNATRNTMIANYRDEKDDKGNNVIERAANGTYVIDYTRVTDENLPTRVYGVSDSKFAWSARRGDDSKTTASQDRGSGSKATVHNLPGTISINKEDLNRFYTEREVCAMSEGSKYKVSFTTGNQPSNGVKNLIAATDNKKNNRWRETNADDIKFEGEKNRFSISYPGQGKNYWICYNANDGQLHEYSKVKLSSTITDRGRSLASSSETSVIVWEDLGIYNPAHDNNGSVHNQSTAEIDKLHDHLTHQNNKGTSSAYNDVPPFE